MNKWRNMIHLLTVILVLSMLSLSFGHATGVKEEKVEKTLEVEEKKPVIGELQYGGTLTLHFFTLPRPGNVDPANQLWPGGLYGDPVLEMFKMDDIETYGPRGTGEYSFVSHKMCPLQYSKGALAESWEVSSDKITFHIRPGVYWAADGREHIMESRVYTADDFAFNLNRLLESPAGADLRTADFIESVTATDRHTVVVKTSKYYPEWWSLIGGGTDGGAMCKQIPPEVVEAGADDYANLIGTGPFILKEYIAGSKFVYTANPNYWGTTTINGKEYKTPFIDELVMPLIGDRATAIAALRTAVLDIHMRVLEPDLEPLTQTAPNLLTAPGTAYNVVTMFLRTDQEPLNNRNVRRALMIGTDRESIHRAVLMTGDLHSFPIARGVPGYVPLEELPPETRLLFDYNPDLARQMLAEADYPDGFEITLCVAARADFQGVGEMVAGMWKKDLNVDVKLKVYEEVAYRALLGAKGYENSIVGHAFPLLAFSSLGQMFYSGGYRNYPMYSNPDFDELFDKAVATVDEAEQKTILEELFVTALDDAPCIPIGTDSWYVLWWPWIKNYYGESEHVGPLPPISLMWIDQALKEKMRY